MGATTTPAVPEDMEVALKELCVLRDVLSHRGGRIDNRAAEDWPSDGLTVGSFVRISCARVRRYSVATGAYGQEVARRLLAATAVDTTPQLANWLSYAFSV
jgi:hypothetical protein